MLVRTWRKKNTYPWLVGVQTCMATTEMSAVVPQKARNSSTPRSSCTTLGTYLKESTSYYRDTCSSVFTAALFTLARNWKQFSCPPMDDWKGKCSIFIQWTIIKLFKKMKISGGVNGARKRHPE